MEIILLTVHIILAVALIAAVLLQPADASMGFGSNSPLSGGVPGRAKLPLAAKVTAWLAVGFICTSLLLGIWASRINHAKSILDQATIAADVVSKIGDKAADAKANDKAPKAPAVPVTP
jgi:preprotein translocase subunit SecG